MLDAQKSLPKSSFRQLQALHLKASSMPQGRRELLRPSLPLFLLQVLSTSSVAIKLNKICFHKHDHLFNEMVTKASCLDVKFLKFLWVYPFYNKVKNEGWRYTQEPTWCFLGPVWGLQGGLSINLILTGIIQTPLRKKRFQLICSSKTMHFWSLHKYCLMMQHFSSIMFKIYVCVWHKQKFAHCVVSIISMCFGLGGIQMWLLNSTFERKKKIIYIYKY